MDGRTHGQTLLQRYEDASNKANSPTMRPRRWAVGVGRLVAVVVMVVAVTLAVVVVSLRMILCVHIGGKL